MYLPLLTEKEQKAVVRALRGWQFIRKNHGSLYDRGGADSYYGRRQQPHYGGVLGSKSQTPRAWPNIKQAMKPMNNPE